MIGHWEIYISRERVTGAVPWAIVGTNEPKKLAEYASAIVIKTHSYTGLSSYKDRPNYVIHCYGVKRRSGSVIYIEEPDAGKK